MKVRPGDLGEMRVFGQGGAEVAPGPARQRLELVPAGLRMGDREIGPQLLVPAQVGSERPQQASAERACPRSRERTAERPEGRQHERLERPGQAPQRAHDMA